jgi:ABC-type Fe3+/spermidine/putrescine transport system ATPase subunit
MAAESRREGDEMRGSAAAVAEDSHGRPEHEFRVEVQGVVKEFQRSGGGRFNALDDVSIDVRAGEIVVLLGPSGCGKSTLLRCIAGLEQPTSGRIRLGGQLVHDSAGGQSVPTNLRDLSMMFQSYALWPHMTLGDNVAYPLRTRGMRAGPARERAEEYLRMVGLGGLGAQYPSTVSGGQQQRAALARTLVSNPSVVLFDEPLSNVDAKVRAQLRDELLQLHQRLKFAAVYVTHDQVEAMGLGGRVAIMREGRVEQFDSPVAIYEHPRTRFAAEFVGEANIVVGEVLSVDGGEARIATPVGDVVAPAADLRAGERIELMMRAERLRIEPDSGEADRFPNRWPGKVEIAAYAGARTEYVCSVSGMRLSVWQGAGTGALIPAGSAVVIGIAADAIRVVSREAAR